MFTAQVAATTLSCFVQIGKLTCTPFCIVSFAHQDLSRLEFCAQQHRRRMYSRAEATILLSWRPRLFLGFDHLGPPRPTTYVQSWADILVSSLVLSRWRCGYRHRPFRLQEDSTAPVRHDAAYIWRRCPNSPG